MNTRRHYARSYPPPATGYEVALAMGCSEALVFKLERVAIRKVAKRLGVTEREARFALARLALNEEHRRNACTC